MHTVNLSSDKTVDTFNPPPPRDKGKKHPSEVRLRLN